MIMTIHSPFAEQEKAAGAVFCERFGAELPEHFGDPAVEYEAVRKRVGLVDLSFRGLIEVKGADRFGWLNGQITNDVKQLRAGEGKLAAVLNVKGHVLADLAVYGLVDSIWVDVNRDRAEIVCGAFDRHIIADDVVAENVSGRYAHLMLVGLKAKDVVAEAAAASPADVLPWHHLEAHLGDTPVRIIASR
jgi:glycine cleavage system aminomethyltransferase T